MCLIFGVGADELGLQILERGHTFLRVVVELSERQAITRNAVSRPLEIQGGGARHLLYTRLSRLCQDDPTPYTEDQVPGMHRAVWEQLSEEIYEWNRACSGISEFPFSFTHPRNSLAQERWKIRPPAGRRV